MPRLPLHAARTSVGESPAGAGVERQGHGEGRCRADGAGEDTLKAANIPYSGVPARSRSACACASATPTTQLKARTRSTTRSIPTRRIRPTWWALNLLPASPRWLTAIHALPMYLGLDLRGGVHFLLQVDMQAAITKHLERPRRRPALAAARAQHPARRHHPRMARRCACGSATPHPRQGARGDRVESARPQRGGARGGQFLLQRRTPRCA